MRNKTLIFMTCLLFICTVLVACSGGGGGGNSSGNNGGAALSSDKAITAFSFTNPEAVGIMDELAKTINVAVPHGTDVTALVAAFSFTGTSVKVGGTEQVSGTTSNDFTNPVEYTVTAADSTTAAYTVTVAVAEPDTTAPITTAAPSVSGTTDTATTLSVTIDENGTGYYLVLPAADTVPTVAAVQAGTSFAMNANVAANKAISGLTQITSYVIYFIAMDAANNVQAAVQSVAVNTAASGAPVVTQPGTATDIATSKLIIAAEGGTLTSPTRDLTITIPAGALSSDTTIAMTPITSTAPGAVGQAWLLGPDGTVFNKPVTLTFKYTDNETLKRSDPDLLVVGFQNADGTWTDLGKPTLDTVNKTFSVQTTHFTPFTPRLSYQLSPSFSLVELNTTLNLRLESCSPSGCVNVSNQVTAWYLETELKDEDTTPYGTLTPRFDDTGALYTAPSAQPPVLQKIFIYAKIPSGYGTQSVGAYIFIKGTSRLHIHGVAGPYYDSYNNYVSINGSDSFDLLIPYPFPLTGIFGNLSYEETNYAPIPAYITLTNQPTVLDGVSDNRAGCMEPKLQGGDANFGNFTHLEIGGTTLWVMGGSLKIPGVTIGSTTKNCITESENVPPQGGGEGLYISLTDAQWKSAFTKPFGYPVMSGRQGSFMTIGPE